MALIPANFVLVQSTGTKVAVNTSTTTTLIPSVPISEVADIISITAASSQQEAIQDLQDRLVPSQTGEGERIGRLRHTDEDQATIVTKDAVIADIQKAQAQIDEAITQQSSASPAVSAKQFTSRQMNQTSYPKQRQADTTRALQNLQRTCNHKFDKASQKCLYCSKRRTSHVYDNASLS